MKIHTHTSFEVQRFSELGFLPVELKQYVLEPSPSCAARSLNFVVRLVQDWMFFQLADVERPNIINQAAVEQVIVSCVPVVAVCI